VTPAQDFQSRMQDMPHRDQNMDWNLTNVMTVTVNQLVEYRDVNNNGYTSEDTVVSTYNLSSEHLGAPVQTATANGIQYTISSADGVFTMYLYLNQENGVANSWKWSVEINYPFQANDTNLAITQTVTSNGNRDINRYYSDRTPVGVPPNDGQINGTEFCDQHQQVPMFFKWDNSALVDHVNMSVSASVIGNRVAINIPQGNTIFYDPQIGVALSDLQSANNFLSSAFPDLSQVVNSPTWIGIILASFLIVSSVAILRYRK